MHPDNIRTLFSRAMSDMYRKEVPQYGDLLKLVKDVNIEVFSTDPQLKKQMEDADELERLDIERHGAIRLGTDKELFNIRRMFHVMGMSPVGYYDLSVAGLPVHSTAFRPISHNALSRNPFRVFTSLIRLELLEDQNLANEASEILSQRNIITNRAIELINIAEDQNGLADDEAQEFVNEALETFRWHSEATVTLETYQRLHDAHRLIADVVSFRGPHINHLTPRTLDIDAVQKLMPERGITPKAIIEGPPYRKANILLRQTSFKALQEKISYKNNHQNIEGSHTARFGEIEQRGIALKPKGRTLYDECLSKTRKDISVGPQGEGADLYMQTLSTMFNAFPDDYNKLRKEDLAYFRYRSLRKPNSDYKASHIDELIENEYLTADPQTYEDFLPVSAAGIFQSNLGSDEQSNYSQKANQKAFEKALGVPIISELSLYENTERESLKAALIDLDQNHLL